MLKTLNIENIAVIEKADIEFSPGLNALTGETGAGKSIVVDSINAILGERTSRELVRHGADSANVSAYFCDINNDVKDKLNEMGLPCEDDGSLLLSRKITAQGKSQCRINGSPCTVTMLKELGDTLVNIHGQHDSQALLNPDFHYMFVDLLSPDKKLYEDYKNSFRSLIKIRRRLKALTADADEKDRVLEMLDYQISELKAADIKVGEWQELKERREAVLNSQTIVQSLSAVQQAMTGDENYSGVENLVQGAIQQIRDTVDIDKASQEIYESLDGLSDAIESIKDLCSQRLEQLNFAPGELDNIESRLDMFYEFSNKYGETEQDMLNYLAEAEKKRDSLIDSDEEIQRLTAEYDEALGKTAAMADMLSVHRKSIADGLEQQVKSTLEFLDMPKIRFVVDFQKGKLSINGYDKIEFLISANPGEPPKPLAKIASGGELSRIMLAIKDVIAKNDTVDTLIFDEVDTGVSGKASRKIGLKLKSVSNSCQVICVTHSAQIASVADAHFLIEKRYDNDKTYTGVQPLDFEGRKRELARIMGGLEITDNMLNSAEELLNNN